MIHGVVSAEEAEHMVSHQGVKMGRPSWVHIRILAEGNKITQVLVGGGSVVVGGGTVIVDTVTPR